MGSYYPHMRTVATLQGVPDAVTPGEAPVEVPLEIRNTGDTVQAYEIEVLGVPAGFASVDPPTVNLYPGTSETVAVRFQAPRSGGVPAGDYPFGVRVLPTEHPDDAVVPESSVQVLPFLETTAELIPRTSRGRRGASHDLAVDNRGNAPMRCVVAASDANNLLELDEKPQVIEIPAGEARFGTIAVKPKERFWRGNARTHPFQVLLTPDTGEPVTLDGTHVQEPRLPSWFFKALLALLALLLLLLALWFLLLRPVIESAAQDAVADEVEAVAEQEEAAAEAAEKATDSAGAAQSAAGDAAEAADDAAKSAGKGGGKSDVVVLPLTRRLTVTTSPGGVPDPPTFTASDNQTVEITDLVFENPQGDIGTLELRVEGDTLLELALENFRAVDYHFVSPITVNGGETIDLLVDCQRPGRPPAPSPRPTSCETSVFVGGEITEET